MTASAYFARHQSLRALEHRDFRVLMAATTLQSVAMPLQFLTMVFWVQDRYPDSDVLYLGLLGAGRGLGMLAFSFVGGAIADRVERRRVLILCESAAAALTVLSAGAMIARPLGDATIVPILVFAFLTAGNMAVDMPARTASAPTIVGREGLASAITLNGVAGQLTFPLVFPLAGVLNAAFDPGAVYLGSAVIYAGILPLLATARFRSVGEGARDSSVFANIKEGLSYTRRDATILAVVLMMLVMQGLGMPGVGMLGPIWMTEVLDLSKQEFGWMGMTWGLGALAASLFFVRQHRLARRGSTLCALVAVFCVGAIVFGHSRLVPLTALANFGLGFGMAGTMVVSTTIVQYLVSDEMRGRVMGLFPLAMGVAMVNTLPVGAFAQGASLEVAVPAMGWATLVLSVAIMVRQPRLRRLAPGVGPAVQPVPAVGG